MPLKRTNNETTILLGKISKQIAVLTEKKPKHERLGLVLSNWSQVVMLLVVLYGYVYTVLPVVQKEQIAEQLAELELEKKSWDKQFNEAAHEIEQKNIELKLLLNSKQQLLSDIKSLNKEKEKSRLNLEKIKKEYNRTNMELNKSKASINIATNDLLVQNRESLLGKDRLPENLIVIINNSTTSYGIFDFEDENSIKKKLEEVYLSPLKYANKNLTDLYNSYKSAKGVNRAAKYKLYIQYKDGIEKHQMNLTCPMPNFEAWEASFIESKSVKKSLVTSCVNNAFNERIKDEKWSQDQVSELKDSAFWPEQEKSYNRSCVFDVKYKIEELFRKEWEKVDEPCKERLLNLNNIILDDYKPSKLKPFTDVTPPSSQLIIHALMAKN